MGLEIFHLRERGGGRTDSNTEGSQAGYIKSGKHGNGLTIRRRTDGQTEKQPDGPIVDRLVRYMGGVRTVNRQTNPPKNRGRTYRSKGGYLGTADGGTLVYGANMGAVVGSDLVGEMVDGVDQGTEEVSCSKVTSCNLVYHQG